MTLAAWLSIVGAAMVWICVVACVWNLRRVRRSCRKILAGWVDEAPPVEAVNVILKTGDKITITPYLSGRDWVWNLPMPAGPAEIEEVLIPSLPPHTILQPVPSEAPRWP